MTVLAIVDLYEQGYSPAQIKADHFPELPLEAFLALTYWAAKEHEIEELFAEDEEAERLWIAEMSGDYARAVSS